ncbi:MAG: PAS domain-containing protein [Ignavibacteriaceae bacterium]
MRTKSKYDDIILKAESLIKEGILIFDAKQNQIPLIHFNKGFKEIAGYTHEEIVGKSYKFLENKESSSDNLKKYESCFLKHHQGAADLFISVKDKPKIYCRISITPIPDAIGEIEYFICIVRNITDAREKMINQLKLSVMYSTLRTVNDIILNYMNSLYLFRVDCETYCDLDKFKLEEFDKDYKATLKKLQKLNEMKEYKEKKIFQKFSVIEHS